jgi:DNA anti-recombination protein RmuC
MPESLITTLLQSTGAFGVILVAIALALRRLHTQISEIQEKRIQDAQSATTQLLQLVNAQHQQMQLLRTAIDSMADAVQDLREAISSQATPPPRAGTQPRIPLPPRR